MKHLKSMFKGPFNLKQCLFAIHNPVGIKYYQGYN